MSESPCVVRNYHPTDYNDYVNLRTTAARPLHSDEGSYPEAIGETLRRPGYDPERDLLVAEVSGKIIGFTEVIPELASSRAVLVSFVLPEHSGNGPEKELLNRAVLRAEEMGAKAVRINVREKNTRTQSLLSEIGFRKEKRYLDLRLSLAAVRIPETANGDYTVKHLQSGEEKELARLQNLSFTGNWEYNPNTTEEIAFALNRKHGSLEDVLLIRDGDKPAGYCWVKTPVGVKGEEKKGRIHMLGVDRDYRQRGVGRSALFHGLRELKKRGVKTVELTVASDNASALSLYRSIGFTECGSSFWYEKVIGQGFQA